MQNDKTSRGRFQKNVPGQAVAKPFQTGVFMKKKLLAAVTFLGLAALARMTLAQSGQAEIKFNTLLQQSQSSHAQKKNYVIRSQAEWQKLWQQMQAASFLPRNVRTDSLLHKIDFTKQMLIAVFQGEQPSGGYSIAVTKLVRASNRLEVFIEEQSPGADCFTTQMLTYPYHIIVTEASVTKVTFTSRSRVAACR